MYQKLDFNFTHLKNENSFKERKSMYSKWNFIFILLKFCNNGIKNADSTMSDRSRRSFPA